MQVRGTLANDRSGKSTMFMFFLFGFTARFIGCCYSDSFFYVEKLVSNVSFWPRFSFVFDIDMYPFGTRLSASHSFDSSLGISYFACVMKY
jgi:hypothetical protein